ncbi:hypothetical protein OPT61_g3631 [Boeremia exigua]|uniref:Uncharacterized protein n=1 Tax=Boeremia exigua TaxID=749465 RepID=A0ACC2IH32_9PLEO|nr:hypothetical protein OPT61_g3631 [Boeremia exigua]
MLDVIDHDGDAGRREEVTITPSELVQASLDVDLGADDRSGKVFEDNATLEAVNDVSVKSIDDTMDGSIDHLEVDHPSDGLGADEAKADGVAIRVVELGSSDTQVAGDVWDVATGGGAKDDTRPKDDAGAEDSGAKDDAGADGSGVKDDTGADDSGVKDDTGADDTGADDIGADDNEARDDAEADENTEVKDVGDEDSTVVANTQVAGDVEDVSKADGRTQDVTHEDDVVKDTEIAGGAEDVTGANDVKINELVEDKSEISVEGVSGRLDCTDSGAEETSCDDCRGGENEEASEDHGSAFDVEEVNGVEDVADAEEKGCDDDTSCVEVSDADDSGVKNDVGTDTRDVTGTGGCTNELALEGTAVTSKDDVEEDSGVEDVVGAGGND